jgi:ubiquinone/menaquinone biosynthesis C-methylase UbiE
MPDPVRVAPDELVPPRESAMSQRQQHTSFIGSIPAFYHRHIGPFLFEPYARDMARRIPARDGVRVLETACGTGIVTRELLRRLPESAQLTATDLNQAMIDFAQTQMAADPRLEWRAADAQQLPFGDAAFDAVVMQFGIMFVPDKPLAVREAKRVLKSGGKLTYSAWDAFARNAFSRITHATFEQMFDADPPTFYQTPFGDPDPEVHRERLLTAGFRDVQVEGVDVEAVSESAEHLAIGLVRGNPVTIPEGSALTIDDVERHVAEALRDELGDHPLRCPLHAWVVTGTV